MGYISKSPRPSTSLTDADDVSPRPLWLGRLKVVLPPTSWIDCKANARVDERGSRRGSNLSSPPGFVSQPRHRKLSLLRAHRNCSARDRSTSSPSDARGRSAVSFVMRGRVLRRAAQTSARLPKSSVTCRPRSSITNASRAEAGAQTVRAVGEERSKNHRCSRPRSMGNAATAEAVVKVVRRAGRPGEMRSGSP